MTPPVRPPGAAEPAVDALDVALLRLLAAAPRIGVLEASRRLGVARGTVQARLDRLADRGVVRGYGPEISPEALGYGVTAFVTLEIRQGPGHEVVAEHLAGIPEVLEAHTITGAGDLLCRLVARSNPDLQQVIDRVVDHPAIVRTSTVIALATEIGHRVLPLLDAAVAAPAAAPVTRVKTRRRTADPLYSRVRAPAADAAPPAPPT